ncbi:hypothetical protein GH714_022097 [Hevea brasiliensis]|uniref:Meiosis-specific protein ASY3-like coiled-coil domain-containing protein n=1 Tax=Hevea brasiliensis TaxID=3981 RepID=A0A6A6NIE3_HEVBR|nr:hypothetical protein GH714_022097 [Hevea brasiliensis]
MKLCEILGTVSSPRSQPSNSQAREAGANNVKQEKIHPQNCDAVVKPVQNSDTIETDSENPDHPDDAVELKDSPCYKSSPLTGRKEVEDGLSESSSEDGDSKALKKVHRDALSPETATAERSTFTLYPSKRLRNHEGNGVPQFVSTSPSPKGTTTLTYYYFLLYIFLYWVKVTGTQSLQNNAKRMNWKGLLVVKLFVLALENFKNKMKSVTRKKSSEILMSVSEDIHLQLQNIESQIQTDVGKLTSISKSKRKRLETRLQEQQEKLKLIHDKFKEDIHQHLHDCKRTVEELEMHHNELKGTVKKQKVYDIVYMVVGSFIPGSHILALLNIETSELALVTVHNLVELYPLHQHL